MSERLFKYVPHPHRPRRVTVRQAEQTLTGFNMKIAVAITRALGTMWCAYLFILLALIGFPGFQATPPQYVQWVSQTFIQLVALSVLAVGQQVLSKHGEMQADESFQTAQHSFHDIEQIMDHLDEQDRKILEILARLEDRSIPTQQDAPAHQTLQQELPS